MASQTSQSTIPNQPLPGHGTATTPWVSPLGRTPQRNPPSGNVERTTINGSWYCDTGPNVRRLQVTRWKAVPALLPPRCVSPSARCCPAPSLTSIHCRALFQHARTATGRSSLSKGGKLGHPPPLPLIPKHGVPVRAKRTTNNGSRHIFSHNYNQKHFRIISSIISCSETPYVHVWGLVISEIRAEYILKVCTMLNKMPKSAVVVWDFTGNVIVIKVFFLFTKWNHEICRLMKQFM